MVHIKNRRYKPIYKKFISLKQNILHFDKIFTFKKRKWQNFIIKLSRNQEKHPREFKLYDHSLYFLPKYSNFFKNSFRYNLRLKQSLQLIYNKLLKRHLKTKIFYIFNRQNLNKTYSNMCFQTLELFENRLDTLLYRCEFVSSIKIARQLIIHKHININKKLANQPSQQLKIGDIIEISIKFSKRAASNIQLSTKRGIPPKYLEVNYRTLQIMFVSKINMSNTTKVFPFWIDLNTFIKYLKIQACLVKLVDTSDLKFDSFKIEYRFKSDNR